MTHHTFEMNGRSLVIDGKLHQIGEDDTIFCPVCHEPVLYWQVPFSSCYDLTNPMKPCPAHEGAYDCNPFCALCEGEQEVPA